MKTEVKGKCMRCGVETSRSTYVGHVCDDCSGVHKEKPAMTFEKAMQLEVERFDRAVVTMRACLVDEGYCNPNHKTFHDAKDEMLESVTSAFNLKLILWKATKLEESLRE